MQQWRRFLSCQALGAAVNYIIYSGMILSLAIARTYPIIAIIGGSITGLALNYYTAARFVFAASKRQDTN